MTTNYILLLPWQGMKKCSTIGQQNKGDQADKFQLKNGMDYVDYTMMSFFIFTDINITADVSITCILKPCREFLFYFVIVDLSPCFNSLFPLLYLPFFFLSSSVELLRNLPSIDLVKLASCLEVDYYTEGEFIIREGSKGDTFYIISNGTVRSLSICHSLPLSSSPPTSLTI